MSEESVGDAGASSLGYYGGVFGPGGRSVAANGFTGALHLWQRSSEATPTGIPSFYNTSRTTPHLAAGGMRVLPRPALSVLRGLVGWGNGRKGEEDIS